MGYFDSALCWHNYCSMLNKIIITILVEEALYQNLKNLSITEMYIFDLIVQFNYLNLI